MLWRCERGHEWEAYVSNRRKGSGCPECAPWSRMEGWMEELARELGLKHKMEWSDPSCGEERRYRFDIAFGVTENDLENGTPSLLIEANGQQHERPVKWSSSMTDQDAKGAFRKIIHRDAFKIMWAKERHIPLVVIRHEIRDNSRDHFRAWMGQLLFTHGLITLTQLSSLQGDDTHLWNPSLENIEPKWLDRVISA